MAWMETSPLPIMMMMIVILTVMLMAMLRLILLEMMGDNDQHDKPGADWQADPSASKREKAAGKGYIPCKFWAQGFCKFPNFWYKHDGQGTTLEASCSSGSNCVFIFWL